MIPMNKKLKFIFKTKIFKTTFIFTSSNIITYAIPFILLPILTRFLTAEDYGIVSMFGIITSILSAIVGVNGHSGIAKFFHEKSKEQLSIYISSTLILLVVSSFIVSIIFIFSGQYIAQLSSLPQKLLWTALVISISQYFIRVSLVLLQVEKKALKYGLFNLSMTTINIILSILFIVGFKLKYEGKVFAQVFTSVFFAIISVSIMINKKWLVSKINSYDLYDAFTLGFPLIFHILGSVIITLIDRFFITNFVGLDQTGIYTVGYQIGTIINLLASSFNLAFQPWLYEKLNLNKFETKVLIVKIIYIYMIIIIFLAFALTVFSSFFLSYFVGQEFRNSYLYVGWIAFGYAFHGMYFMVSSFIFYTKKTKYLGIVMMFLAILNIILNVIMVPIFGALGAAYATTIVYFLQFIFVWLISHKIYSMPWNIFKNYPNSNNYLFKSKSNNK
jgi:O-antigen/teichoic acid export membrane protein